jgi:hypothetical protein
MPLVQHVLTLNGSAQQVGAALSVVDNAIAKNAIWVSLQPDTANTGVVLVGDANLSATLYGARLEAPATAIPPAPFVFDLGQMQMSLYDIWVKGTNAEKLRLLVIYG